MGADMSGEFDAVLARTFGKADDAPSIGESRKKLLIISCDMELDYKVRHEHDVLGQ